MRPGEYALKSVFIRPSRTRYVVPSINAITYAARTPSMRRTEISSSSEAQFRSDSGAE